MPLARIEQLLKDTMGLDVASVGPAVIAHAVKERQRACQLKDAAAYWQRVQESSIELQRLIEAVVVPETWFFRDRDAFAALSRVAREEWLRDEPHSALRLLSAPCSTGEEPYSMAMALLDGGVAGNRFHIDAIDISERVLAHARNGRYRNSSFRGDDVAFRERHFSATADGHQIVEAVRRQVHFQQGNLLSSGFLSETAPFDVIFCRNVLIYFDRETQSRAITVLARLLKPRGLLFVGPAETGVFLNSGLVSARVAMAFAFRKAPAIPPKAAAPAPVARPRSTPSAAAPAPPPARVPPAPPRLASERNLIDEARQLADEGHFVDAALRCEEHVRTHGPSADAFYLLGLVRDASGNHLDASHFYRKALYLNPNHREAVIHLALLLEEQGRPADARVVRNRMKRLEQQPKA